MDVLFTKLFLKEIAAIRDSKNAQKIHDIIFEVKQVNHPSNIKNLKKLKGHKNAYRIKLGDYRIGVFIENNSFEFCRFLHRKEIYRYFP